ncbi:Holliday junction resolvase RuvX [Sinomonas sp. ASV322]|uniref:Holliday junction resolvase RuvX n=1 Tax=Sinomonas sp. ASV322 TaxID=3041920 RepID=UPI0027DD60D9|nr:Holliday junction resolvase RuvX [Sinomonas sp. ASV322]MDQ4501145.1 Holliday junction resolvase RuvX [Sinomonas sp. ASV322]
MTTSVPDGQSSGFSRGVRLGVDVGAVRVGLAACDPDGILASPVRTLERDAKKNRDIRLITREAEERNAVQIFVGLPRTLKGAETASAEFARGFAGRLADSLARAGIACEVRLVDERLTTVEAHRSLRSAGLSTRDHRRVVDQVAAVGILEHALTMLRRGHDNVGELVPPTAEDRGGIRRDDPNRST